MCPGKLVFDPISINVMYPVWEERPFVYKKLKKKKPH